MRPGLAILLAGLIGFCGAWAGATQATAAERGTTDEVLRIGLPLQPDIAIVLVALKQGYFADQGLRIAVTEYPSGKIALMEGLFAGKEDLVTAPDVLIALSGFDRNDFKIIATIYAVDNHNRVIARKDRGISTPRDLRGKRIATQSASAVHFFLSLFLANHGIADHEVEITFAAPHRLPEILSSGAVDAISMREPIISQAKVLLGGNAVVFDAPGLYDQTVQVVVSDAFLDKRPDAVVKILRALIRAEEYVQADSAAAKRIVAERLGIAPAQVAAVWPRRPPRVSLDQSLLSRLEAQARWAIRNKLVNTPTVPNYLNVIYLRGLDAVKPRAITVVR
ncbi:MAG: ABC transporter substrate-binding protein [Rhodospirillales bacterium]|nr:ABC transporter substrate-binding protein [Rhodospirillales bacterium]